MIKLNKSDKPQILVQNEIQWNQDYVAYVNGQISDVQAGNRHRHSQIREAVNSEAHGKCIYCEEKILSSQFGDVDHICPKSIYPQFYATWTNLGLSCSKCNNAKRDKDGFIDPFSEDPSIHLYFLGPMVNYYHGSIKGSLTVRGIKLNRGALLEKRTKALEALIDKIELMQASPEPLRAVIHEEILVDVSDEAEFAGTLRAYYTNVANDFED